MTEEARWAFLNPETGDWIEVKPGTVEVVGSGEESDRLMAVFAPVPTDVPGLRAALAELVHLNTLKPYGHVGIERLPWFTHNPTSHAEGAACRSCSAVAAGRAALAASQPVPADVPAPEDQSDWAKGYRVGHLAGWNAGLTAALASPDAPRVSAS